MNAQSNLLSSQLSRRGGVPVHALTIKQGVTGATTLKWQRCERDDIKLYECATLVVPLDRLGKDPGEVALAVIRAPATGSPEDRIGSLFFNPGGPGSSGLKFFSFVHAQIPPHIARHYDLVSWDPRGVGETKPALLDCPMPWVARPEGKDIDWGAVFDAHYKTIEQANRQCQKANAAYIKHLGTMNVIEDLEALRKAVGDQKLAFAGYSYGTRIGSVYAQVHPDKVGPLLLDGAVDPTSSILRFVSEGGRAMDEALGHYFQFEPNARKEFSAAWEALGAEPLTLVDGARFDRWNFLDIALLKMTFQADMPKIGEMARQVLIAKSPTATGRDAALEALALELKNLGPNTDTGGMFAVVNCLDYADRPSPATLRDVVMDNARRGGVFGGSLTISYAATCAGFDFPPDAIPLATPMASEHPILIGGATRDSRTPYQWSVQMARAFPNSRILTYPGGNHVNWFIGSPCLKAIMDEYFVGGMLPSVDAVCDYAPNPKQ